MTTATVDIRSQLGLQPVTEITKYLNLMIFGPWGVGKTFLSATAEDHKDLSPVLHLGFEQGLSTVEYRKGYNAREIRTIAQLEQVYDIVKADVDSGKRTFKTLIFDNGTEIQNLDIDTVMRETKATARNPDNVDIDIPSPREWGKLRARLRRTVQGFRDLEINTIWTCWEGVDKDSDGNITRIYPRLAGSIKEEMGGYFDIVGYLRIRTTNGVNTRILQVTGTEKVKAKWRNKPDEIPDVIEDPNIPDMWNAILKHRKAQAAANA